MKVPNIKAQIIERYAKLGKLRNSSKNPVIRVDMGNWHAEHSEIDNIWYRKGLIDVQVLPNDVDVRNKPFFLTKKWALRKANKALKAFLDNYNNYDAVKKVRGQMDEAEYRQILAYIPTN